MPRLSENARAAVFMMASMAGFSANDALMKLVSSDLGLFQAVFIRGLWATGLISVLAWSQGALKHALAHRDRRIVILRSAAEIGGTVCFLTALFNMPIANATAILQSVPLAVTLAAALFFGEKVGWRRYLAILIGFAGVLVIVRPGSEGFNSYALFAVAAIGFITMRDLSTRRLSPDAPALLVSFATSLALTIAAGIAAPAVEWRPVEAAHLAILGVGAVCILTGYVFGVMTMRIGEIGVVQPFRYTLLLWSIFFGLLLFGERPDAWMLAGSAIVVAAGLFTFYRERRLGLSRRDTALRPAAAPIPPRPEGAPPQ